MTAKNKLRGNANERAVQKMLRKYGVTSKRAWGSNGEALGLHSEVDIFIPPDSKTFKNGLYLQCKKKKSIPKWLGYTDNVDGVIVAENYGRLTLIIDFEMFLREVLSGGCHETFNDKANAKGESCRTG